MERGFAALVVDPRCLNNAARCRGDDGRKGASESGRDGDAVDADIAVQPLE